MEQFKETKDGHEGRLAVKVGIDRAADKVRPTLGAVGMTVLIEYPGLDPVECDDGVTILKSLNFKDHYENMGLQKLRKAAITTSTQGGDGTATTTVLTQALIDGAIREMGSDSSKSRDIAERIDRGVKAIVSELETMKKNVSVEDIESIAAISSLDPEVSKIIAEIIKEIGINGVIEVERSSKLGYEKEVVPGARFAKGLVSQYFMNDRENEQCVLENPYIALIDRKVSIGTQLESIMDSISKTGNKSVLFICDDMDSTALASLVQASKNVTLMLPDGKSKTGTYDVAVVRNPYTATPSKDFLKDIAALTGATIISEEAGMKLSEATVAVLGKASKVIITKDTTTIIGCQKTPALAERVASIKKDIEATTSDFSLLMLKERLARLDGGIGLIKVGTYTDSEFHTKKYKFDNAIHAVQAAMEMGILPGGGSALARVQVTDPIFKDVLIAPIKQMAINAGMEWYDVLSAVRLAPQYHGFDFLSKSLVNMFDAGIVDPFKVTKLALESAGNIAQSVVRWGGVIAIKDEKPALDK